MSYVLIVTFSNAPFLRAPDSTLVSKPKIIAFEESQVKYQTL